MTQESIHLFAVLVPAVPKAAPQLQHTWILRGSAIVAELEAWEAYAAGGMETPALYYEGGSLRPKSFREKLLHASDRLRQRYPTSSVCAPSAPDQYEIVGILDRSPWNLDIVDAVALERWGVGPAELEAARQPELRPLRSHELAKMLRSPHNAARLVMMIKRDDSQDPQM